MNRKGDIRKNAAKDLYHKLQKSDRDVYPVKPLDLQVGKFYFFFYDLAGKTSKMEQYSPILLVDWKKVKTKIILYGLCFNFIPSNIRILYFDKLLDKFQTTVQDNIKVDDIFKEDALTGLNFANIYKSLLSTGFEYSIREFDFTKIDKAYVVATQYLPNFLIFDTQPFTGVDEGKLVEIWQAKIRQQEERHKEIMKRLQTNYDDMAKLFEAELQTIEQNNQNLEKSIQHMNKLSAMLKKDI